jgi:hypothetical protein
MARRLRFIPENSLVEVSNRTLQGRFLLTPNRELTAIILGVLGRAQALYGIAIHAFIFLSDHYHMLVTSKNGKQLADFVGYVDGNIAKEAGKLGNWRGKFWGQRYQAIPVSDEEEAQIGRLKYLFSNGCKEGLVASPREWVGTSAVNALRKGMSEMKGIWYNRTKEYRARLAGRSDVFPSVETVKLTPLPCWRNLNRDAIRSRVSRLIKEIEKETRKMHLEQRTSPAGMNRVLARHPHERPKSMKRSRAPLFHAASVAARKKFREAYNSFVEYYRQAADRLKAGETTVQFPLGSFPPPRPFLEAYAPG